MKPTYRIVHFVPDPFSGARIPIAALVRLSEGRVAVARSASLLGSHFPSMPTAGVIDLISATLSSATDIYTLPAASGPQAVLGPPAEVPETVADPVRWIENFVLPRGAVAKPRDKHTGIKIGDAGMRFFKQFSVGKFVRKQFHPTTVWPTLPSAAIRDLQTVTHWAGGDGAAIVLMEPIGPVRIHLRKGAV